MTLCHARFRSPYAGITQIRSTVEGRTFLSACIQAPELFFIILHRARKCKYFAKKGEKRDKKNMRWSNSRATGKLPPREIGSSTDAGANLHICVLTLFPSRLIIKAEEINVFPQRREMSEFGNNLYRLRKLRGWTQQELADQLGVTNRSVSKWETGETLPETGQLLPLADAFGVTVDELLRGPKAPWRRHIVPKILQ